MTERSVSIHVPAMTRVEGEGSLQPTATVSLPARLERRRHAIGTVQLFVE